MKRVINWVSFALLTMLVMLYGCGVDTQESDDWNTSGDGKGGSCTTKIGSSPMIYYPVEDHCIPCTTYNGHPENGCDIAVAIGTSLYAPVAAKVVEKVVGCPNNTRALGGGGVAEYTSPAQGCGWGNYIMLQTPSGYKFRMAHMDTIFVDKDATVCAGQQVGTAGSSGKVGSRWGGNGSHLHLSCIKPNGVAIKCDQLWKDSAAYKGGSLVQCSNVNSNAFDRPVNQTPTDGQVIPVNQLPIRFTWLAPSGNPEAYRVIITDKLSLANEYYADTSKADNCLNHPDAQKRCLVSKQIIKDTFYDFNHVLSLSLNTTLYWVVRAGSSTKGGLFSSPTSFQVSTSMNQPCQGKADGLWCGQMLGLDVDTLYECIGGQHRVNQTCEDGCSTQAQGTNDKCNEPQTTQCPFGTGLYCGDADGRDAGNLYRCDNGRYTFEQACSDGCQSNGNGTNDSCKTAMSSCPSGDGLYCGSTLGLNRETLYNCQNGQSVVFEQCMHGCKEAPSGQNDSCNPAPPCNNQCSRLGQERCFGSSQFQICQADAQGCLDWSNAQNCPANQTCNANTQQCEDQRECTNEGAILQSGTWNACNYATQCAESAERTRMVTRCINGKRVVQVERDTQGCNRSTQGNVINTGSWGQCASFSNICDSTGTRSRTVTRCASGQTISVNEDGPCSRNTEGVSCGSQMICSNDNCIPEPQCSAQQEGQVINYGTWGSCSYQSSCAQQGTRQRTNGVCRNGQIVQEPQTDNSGCQRNTNNQVINTGNWGTCSYQNQCSTTGTRQRTNTVCLNGQQTSNVETDTQGCNRSTDGTVLSQGNWSSCSYGSICSEQGTRSRQTVTCSGGQQTTMTSTDTCNRNTDGQSCGNQMVCNNATCVSNCSASSFWSPSTMSGSDSFGDQYNAPNAVNAKMTVTFRDKQSSGNLEFRVCKSGSNFLGNPIHVYFEDWVKHSGYVMIDRDVSTSSNSACTGWTNVSGEYRFNDGDRMGGQMRIVSPTTSKTNWGRWCNNPQADSGSCWYINTSTMQRTCKE